MCTCFVEFQIPGGKKHLEFEQVNINVKKTQGN